MEAQWAGLSCPSSQGQTGNTTTLGNIHPELPAEVQLRRRHTKEGQKHLETAVKGEVERGANPASKASRLKVSRDPSAARGLFPRQDPASEPRLGCTAWSNKAQQPM